MPGWVRVGEGGVRGEPLVHRRAVPWAAGGWAAVWHACAGFARSGPEGLPPQTLLASTPPPQPTPASLHPHPSGPSQSPGLQNQHRMRHGETASRPLVLTAKGRADVLLSLAAANVTGTGPHVAGIVLTDAGRAVG